MNLRNLVDRFLGPPRLDVTGRFELDRQAISGTMSQVYRARDRQTGEKVALKLLDPEKTAAFRRIFAGLDLPREGEIGLSLRHPRVVATVQHGVTTEGREYVLMEQLDGEGLHDWIARREPLLTQHRVRLIRWAAEALAAVHAAGYVHRDICPRNFIVDRRAAWLKLIDFGLTIPARREFLARPNRTGVPRYLAPEILRMRPFDQRADLFSLGVTAYEMCALAHPWPGGDVTGQAALDHDTTPPIELAQASRGLDPTLAAAIMACLAPDPNHRPRSAAELLQRIHSVQE
jgi:serine/threonine-protein kinase